MAARDQDWASGASSQIYPTLTDTKIQQATKRDTHRVSLFHLFWLLPIQRFTRAEPPFITS